MKARCKEKNNISAEKKNTLCGDGNDFFERSNGKDLQRKQKPLAGKHAVIVRAQSYSARMYSLSMQTIF